MAWDKGLAALRKVSPVRPGKGGWNYHAAAWPPAAQRLPAGGNRVLLAEDNPVNLRMIKHLLERQGLQVWTAQNGQEALELASRQAFDLVLMDVQMPGMDGLEASAQLRARFAGSGRRLPIVALTALEQQKDLEACLAAGMDDFLGKPLQPERLRAVLERYLPGQLKTVRAVPHRGGDSTLQRKLIAVFLQDYPQQLQQLQKALQAQDETALQRGAHAVKGTLGVFRFEAGMAAALALEQFSSQAQAWGEAAALMAQLEALVAQFVASLPTDSAAAGKQP